MSISNNIGKCCGCMSCYSTCPHDAIVITEDDRGFYFPKVDENKCINCGLCEKVCDYNNAIVSRNTPRNVLSLSANEEKVLKNSTSGGAFSLITDQVLNKDGVVFATALREDFSVAIISARTQKERNKMRGSIYVQSYVGNTYKNVKEQVQCNTEVAFIGTPCQVAGLRAYLGKDYENLVLIEILCHGVPSNKLFLSHIELLEQKYNRKAIGYTFRNKKFAWWTHGIAEVAFSDGGKKSSYDVQSFLNLFQRNLSLRESCISCPYKKAERCADITLGDCWDKKLSFREKRYGKSLVLINTEKGESFLDILKENSKYEEKDLDYVKKRLSSGTRIPRTNLNKIWEIYIHSGYSAVINQYVDSGLTKKLKFKLKKTVARIGTLK